MKTFRGFLRMPFFSLGWCCGIVSGGFYRGYKKAFYGLNSQGLAQALEAKGIRELTP